MFGEMIDSAMGFLFGRQADTSVTSVVTIFPEVSRSDVYARGWHDWVPPYMNTLDRAGSPYDYPRVWIWRLEWEFPHDADPNKLAPQMNVSGLLWKPWAPTP